MARHKHKLQTCPNCDHSLELHYEFCPTCGQENHDIRVPIGHIGYEFVEGITHFDTKIWNSLKYYFTKPGQMTKEYLEGKRARFVPPPRFYIFVSVIFFIILSGLSHKMSDEIKLKANDINNDIVFFQDSLEFRLSKSDAKIFFCLDQNQADSLLISNKNPLSKDFNKLRTILRDSIIFKTLRINKIGLDFNEITNGSFKKIEEAEKQDSSDDGGFEFDVEVDFGDKKENKIIYEDSIKAIAFVLEIDSLYRKLNCADFTTNKLGGIGILNNEYTAREIELAQTFTDKQLDSLILKHDSTARVWMHRPFLRNSNDYKNGNVDALFTNAIKAFSTGMFLFMPIIAFITFIFFRRIRKFYVEHLVFSIHTHTFIFLVLSIYLVIRNFLGGNSLGAFIDKICIYALTIGLPIYIIMSIKTVFENSWIKSIFKFFVISFIYSILLSLFVVGAFILGVFL